VAVRQERVLGDGRERRGRRGALRGRLHLVVHGAHAPTHGSCQRPSPASSRSASSGPHEPFSYGWTGGGASSSGCMILQVSSTPSCRVKRVESPRMAAESSTS